MDLALLANLGDAIGGLGVVVSLLYLAIQIRQNTKAVRSSTYHQAPEQTWNHCLVVAQDESLAERLAKRTAGENLRPPRRSGRRSLLTTIDTFPDLHSPSA